MRRILIPEAILTSDESNPSTLKSEEGKLYVNNGEVLCSYSGANNPTEIKIYNLPQQDPAVSGMLWQDNNGFLKISLG